MAIYLAIDLGTTGCRSILFDSALNQISDCYKEYPLITPSEDYVEQDANLWWELTLETAKGAIDKSSIAPKEIAAISVSSQGITLIPVDKEVTPLCNAISWLDERAKIEEGKIIEDFGFEEIFRITGKALSAAYFLPKLLWLKENRPEIYNAAYKFLMPLDFITAKLTGECVTDRTIAAGTLLYDIKENCWHDKIIDHYSIDKSKLPLLKWSGEVAGKVLPNVARELNLSDTCIVAVGAQDQKCAALGAGLNEDTVTLSLGTAGVLCRYYHETEQEYKGINWSPYIRKGDYTTEGIIPTAASCLRALRDVKFADTSYAVIDAEAQEALNKKSDVFFYPTLQVMNGFVGNDENTTRGELALAVMEGIAFGLLEFADKAARKTVLFGGAAKSDLWCKIVADVLNTEILVPSTEEAAAAGAAILAGIAAKEFDSENPPSLPSAKRYLPTEKAGYYLEKYKRYTKMKSFFVK